MTHGKVGPHSKAIHGGNDPVSHHGAVSVPIYQTSTFAFPSAEEGAARFLGESRGLIYTRLGNPTVQALETCVADLEGGCGAVGAATGMGAVSTVFWGLLQQGDHVVSTRPLYGPSGVMLERRLSRFGVTTTFVNASEPGALAGIWRQGRG